MEQEERDGLATIISLILYLKSEVTFNVTLLEHTFVQGQFCLVYLLKSRFYQKAVKFFCTSFQVNWVLILIGFLCLNKYELMRMFCEICLFSIYLEKHIKYKKHNSNTMVWKPSPPFFWAPMIIKRLKWSSCNIQQPRSKKTHVNTPNRLPVSQSQQWLNHSKTTGPIPRRTRRHRDKKNIDEKMIESQGISLVTSAAQGLLAD